MRQFITDSLPQNGSLIFVTGKDFKYLRQVLRVKCGDMISVRTKDETLYNSTVAQIDDSEKKITLQLCADFQKSVTRGVQAFEVQEEQRGLIEYTLFQFIPRPQKFELILRQAVECGISTVVPVIGEYSEKSSVRSFLENKKERFERIIREARQQSGSPVNSRVTAPMSLEAAVEFWSGDLGFVLSERDCEKKSIHQLISEKEPSKICIAVGCEGGISPSEMEFLEKKALFHSLHFSVNILRCETAALYGIAAVQTAV